jgi:beta-mannosidase
MHLWDAWNRADYTAYRTHTPRFATEFGFQGPPAAATLQRAIPADQLAWDSPAMLHHQKQGRGQEVIQARLAEHFEIPDDFDDWHYLTQLNQARAITCAVEWMRSRRPTCMGTLYWQLNDCWPVISWAAVDGDARPKPLWFATRRFFADRLLTIQPEGERLVLFADNDTDHPWQGTLRVARMGFDGKGLAIESMSLSAAPRRCARLGELSDALARPGNPAAELIVAQAGDARALWFFDVDKNLDYPAPVFEAELTQGSPARRLRVEARSLLVDVAVFADRLDADARVSDQLITLLPGESATFAIESHHPLERDALISPPVFQCANRFGRRPPG